jgi:hypothetical protein
MKKPSRTLTLFMLALVVVMSWAAAASASESIDSNDWRFKLGLYFWGASIGGQATAGDDIDVDFDDILDSLNFAFMGVGEIGKGRWSLTADVIYLDAEDSSEVMPGVKADLNLTNWVVTPFVSYNAVDNKGFRLDILGGARFLYMDTELKIELDPILQAGDSDENWDGIVGIRGGIDLNKHWYLPYHFDIGAGNSDLTFQAYGGIGYRFKHLDVVVAYRYLSWDFDDYMGVDDLHFQGPMAGLKFRF